MITDLMTRTPCVLGCRTSAGEAFPAQPGYVTCDRCAEDLRAALREVVELYALLDDALLPGSAGTGTRGSPGYGSRSPARDGVLTLTDSRTQAQDEGDPHSVLEVLSSWADNVRQDAGMVPRDVQPSARRDAQLLLGWLDWTTSQPWATRVAGRAAELRGHVAALLGLQSRTVSGEAGLLVRWLDFVTRQYWVVDLVAEVRELRQQLRTAVGLAERSIPVGTCPARVHDLDAGLINPCGATLRASLTSERITCRSCGSSWPRERWDELRDALGSPLSDVASLSVWLTVPAGTLRRWRSEDQWDNHGTRSRPLYARTAVLASWQRRRGGQARSA